MKDSFAVPADRTDTSDSFTSDFLHSQSLIHTDRVVFSHSCDMDYSKIFSHIHTRELRSKLNICLFFYT